MKHVKLIILLGMLWIASAVESTSSEQGSRYKEMYQLAVSLARKKEFSSAINYFNYLLKINSEDDKVRYLKAKAHYLNKDAYKALIACNSVKETTALKKCSEIKQRAKSEYPNEYLLFDAYRFLSNGALEKSKRIVDQLIEIDSNNPKYRFILGKILHAQGDLYRAYDHYHYVKDFVSRRQREKIQKSIVKLLDTAKPLIEYVKNTEPKSSTLDLDEYWQMFCLAIHVSTAEIANSRDHLTIDAIKFLKSSLEAEDLDHSKRFNLLVPMLDLYSLSGEAEKAYELVQIARNTNPETADKARLDFTEELLRIRHPMLSKNILKRLK